MAFNFLALFKSVVCFQFHFYFNHFNCLVTFVTLNDGQAERELHPWIAKDDDQGQKMWRVNQRIVKLIVELMRNHDNPESLVILASASDLLLRATDGMLVDGEACTLPQLEVISSRINFLFCIAMAHASSILRPFYVLQN